jgi:hypothetical protein
MVMLWMRMKKMIGVVSVVYIVSCGIVDVADSLASVGIGCRGGGSSHSRRELLLELGLSWAPLVLNS